MQASTRVFDQTFTSNDVFSQTIVKIGQTYLSDCLAILFHLCSQFMAKICLKAPSYYSASFWIHNFSICLWERPKPLMFMISGFSDVSPSPKPNCFCLWRRQDTSNNPGNSTSFLKDDDFYKSQKVVNRGVCCKHWTRWAPDKHEDPS